MLTNDPVLGRWVLWLRLKIEVFITDGFVKQALDLTAQYSPQPNISSAVRITYRPQKMLSRRRRDSFITTSL